MKMKFRKITVAALASAIFLHAALADDAYFHLPVSSLHFTDGALPDSSGSTGLRAFPNGSALSPYAILEGEGEIYLGGEGFVWWESPRRLYQNLILAIRAHKDKVVTGRLFVPNEDRNGMTPLTFRFEAGAAKAESREAFLTAKQNHYRRLMEANLPGGAWFRHQEQEAARAGSAKTTNAPVNPNRFASRR